MTQWVISIPTLPYLSRPVSPGVKRKVITLLSSPRLFPDCCKITNVNVQLPLPDTSSRIDIIWIRPYISTKLLTSQWFLDPGKLQSLETLACFHVVTWVTLVTGSKGMRGWVAPWFSNVFFYFIFIDFIIIIQFSSVTQSCPTLCNPMNCSTPGLPVHHQLPESTQTHVHWVSDAVQPIHPLLSPSPPALNLSPHQGLFQWISSSYQVAQVMELQHQSFQWIFRTDFL